jgi:ankyrin repeat protein
MTSSGEIATGVSAELLRDGSQGALRPGRRRRLHGRALCTDLHQGAPLRYLLGMSGTLDASSLRIPLLGLLLALVLALPSLADDDVDMLTPLLRAPVAKDTGLFVDPDNASKLRALLKADPKLANEPIYPLRGEEISTPLVEALKVGNLEAVRALFEFKAKPNLALGRYPTTPLEASIASGLSGNVRLSQLRLVLAAGANAKLGLHDWAACTSWADRKTYFAAADLLVQARADANAADELGATPLLVAVVNDNSLAVEKLLALGARVSDEVLKAAAAGGASNPEGQKICKLLKVAPVVPRVKPKHTL